MVEAEGAQEFLATLLRGEIPTVANLVHRKGNRGSTLGHEIDAVQQETHENLCVVTINHTLLPLKQVACWAQAIRLWTLASWRSDRNFAKGLHEPPLDFLQHLYRFRADSKETAVVSFGTIGQEQLFAPLGSVYPTISSHLQEFTDRATIGHGEGGERRCV